jgi:hypothetical protein
MANVSGAMWIAFLSMMTIPPFIRAMGMRRETHYAPFVKFAIVAVMLSFVVLSWQALTRAVVQSVHGDPVANDDWLSFIPLIPLGLSLLSNSVSVHLNLKQLGREPKFLVGLTVVIILAFAAIVYL